MQAWKLPDGRYRLIGTWEGVPRAVRRAVLSGEATYDYDLRDWVVTPRIVDSIGAERVFGVITEASSCGCDPVMFRWVGEREVEAGRTKGTFCPQCSPRQKIGRIVHSCPIIEVCGEADVAREVFEAEFAGKLDALV